MKNKGDEMLFYAEVTLRRLINTGGVKKTSGLKVVCHATLRDWDSPYLWVFLPRVRYNRHIYGNDGPLLSCSVF
jgi:hypothetical protein